MGGKVGMGRKKGSARVPYDLSMDDLYLAYKKAKVESFYERSHFSAIAYARYERNLTKNIASLHARLTASSPQWMSQVSVIGAYTYAPKGLDKWKDQENELHCRNLNPVEEWRRRFKESGSKRKSAEFRLLIVPTIDFQIISALWILHVGHKYEAILDSAHCFANRIRRSRENGREHGPPNSNCLGIFVPYFSGYRKWRALGLRAIRSELEQGNTVAAVTMDLERYYHGASPAFLLRESFLERFGVQLSAFERQFTSDFVQALSTWYQSTPDYERRRTTALPIGLSASKVIANVLLAQLDREIVKRLRPVYYGRYVDDVFLVVHAPDKKILSGQEVLRKICAKVGNLLVLEENERPPKITVNMDYSRDSRLIFTGLKQKVFYLQGKHGLDLISHIEGHIRRQSSEHRLLSVVPSSSEGMAARALLVQPDATLEADALRKSEAISVRRLGLSLLIRDIEAYCRDLPSKEWKGIRDQFAGLVNRHVLTPEGIFSYSDFLHRTLGVLIASGDFKAARGFLRGVVEILRVLRQTTTAGTTQKNEFLRFRNYIASGFLQVTVQAMSMPKFSWRNSMLKVFANIAEVSGEANVPTTERRAKIISDALYYSDLGRRPYRDGWQSGKRRPPSLMSPVLPIERSIIRPLGIIRKFRKAAGLKIPHWPAVVFATRPLSLSEIVRHVPQWLDKPSLIEKAVLVLRGARVDSGKIIHKRAQDNATVDCLCIDGERHEKVLVAVPSIETLEADWHRAADNNPNLSLGRYVGIKEVINTVLRQNPKPSYVVFPELSMPKAWAFGIANGLAKHRISIISGIEYEKAKQGLRNRAMISLATQWGFYPANIILLQDKREPAIIEARLLATKHKGAKLYSPSELERKLMVIEHGGFSFAVLICSDLTDISLRNALRGEVDAILGLAWNNDLETFGSLVESAAYDLHCYIVLSNNRLFGDSRIRVPASTEHERDVIRIKGGVSDYVVSAYLDVSGLRDFQKGPKKIGKEGKFKALPIGYKMSKRRKV